MEPPFRPLRILIDQERKTGYWLIEGKLVYRPQGPVTGTSIGFIGHPVHPTLGSKMPNMLDTDNGALEDIPGRLSDLDQEGIDRSTAIRLLTRVGQRYETRPDRAGQTRTRRD